MILIATHSRDIGADLVIRHLAAHQCNYLRMDTDLLGVEERHFAFENGQARLIWNGLDIAASDVTAIWARRFALPKMLDRIDPAYRLFTQREMTLAMDAFIESCHGLHVNTYEADRRAGNRLLQGQLARTVGFFLPETLVTQVSDKALQFVRKDPTIAKAISFGAIEEGSDRVVHTSMVSDRSDFKGVGSCPVLLQRAIPKKREWRITIVGEKIFSAQTKLDIVNVVDWRTSSDLASIFELGDLPEDVAVKMLSLSSIAGLQFGAHDLIETPSGDFYFLETNPAGQWGWLELTLGVPVGSTLADLLKTGTRKN